MFTIVKGTIENIEKKYKKVKICKEDRLIHSHLWNHSRINTDI